MSVVKQSCSTRSVARERNAGVGVPVRDQCTATRELSTLLVALLALGLPVTSSAAPGDLDPTFGRRGIVTTAVTPVFSIAEDVVLQADGQIVVAGHAIDPTTKPLPDPWFAVARYLPNGRLDPSFGTGGAATAPEQIGHFAHAATVALQPDGKIVLGGSRGSHISFAMTVENFGLARFDAQGHVDAGFGSGGLAGTGIPFSQPTSLLGGSGVRDLAVAGAGRIVAVGSASPGSPDGASSAFAVARFLADGTLDSSFASQGAVPTFFGSEIGSFAGASAVALDGEGRILVAGGASTASNGSAALTSDLALARYLASGDLDPSFGMGGRMRGPFPGGIAKTAFRPDGRIVATGGSPADSPDTESRWVIAQYAADGAVDASFGEDGVATLTIPVPSQSETSLVFDRQGRILLTGCRPSAPNSGAPGAPFVLLRLLPDGTPDPSFGDGGMVTTPIGDESCSNAAAVQNDGNIVVAGAIRVGDVTRFALTRYLGGDDTTGCTPSSQALCLQGGRFRVEATWHDFTGGGGPAMTAQAGTSDSGILYFYGPDNWEILVKVLNGCGANGNGRYWVFAAAATTLDFDLHVTDTQTGLVRDYPNPLGQPAGAITDTEAFATCP
jgi:uncharacterized delta-60 repeat protein